MILSKERNLSVYSGKGAVCRHLTDGGCSNYNQRPFICKLYPFVVNLDKAVCREVFDPSISFLPENLGIHSGCPGYGKGKRVFGNRSLTRSFSRLGEELALKAKKSLETGEDISKFI